MGEKADTDIEILLVEDNPGDIRLIEEALQETASTLHITRDGQEALNFLRQNNEFSDAPQPDLILLDLNLPKVDGTQILDKIRNDPVLGGIRVVVVTSAREKNANVDREVVNKDDFITKPADPDEFMARVQEIIPD